jgi:sugar/nucleoside kinase (ribokinase family)
MPFTVQRDLVDVLAGFEGAFLSLDPYRLLNRESLEDWRGVISRIDAFFLSEDEMEIGSREDAGPALRSLAGGRLRFVFFKRGAKGGLLYDARDDRLVEWGPRAAGVVDPTGAGDAFAAGFLAGWLAGEGIEAALARGVVTASFAIEDWGTAGLLRASPAAAAARLAEWSPG